MLYGHFIEHFHRQIYGGVFDPGNPLSDADGFRTDVLSAMRRIRVPILRWPGGCFVSTYNWKKAIGKNRVPAFDKTWRAEDSNAFGTDEYVALCRKIGCEPYICTNAGTGAAEDMSDWMEYCNLDHEGEYARLRIANGHREPHNVKYWSIGNENYGEWELGAKAASEWGRLVMESAKLMRHVDPTATLSAATIADLDWNLNLLKYCGRYIDLVSIHKYWDHACEESNLATYDQAMACTNDLDTDIRRVRGLLTAFGLEKKIKIAYDEWNLRGWHHPNVRSIHQGVEADEYLTPRDLNDRNQDYTMADAVFSACFLNAVNRNCDIVAMANFSPIVNTRGCIYTYKDGIVLRGTYYVFDLYVNYMGDEVLDTWTEGGTNLALSDKWGNAQTVSELDVLCTRCTENGALAISVVNKNAEECREVSLPVPEGCREYRVITVNGASAYACNDIGVTQITLREGAWLPVYEGLTVTAEAHSVNVIQIR